MRGWWARLDAWLYRYGAEHVAEEGVDCLGGYFI
jgi:hypothetical protein